MKFKLWSGTQNNFPIPPKLAKNGTSDDIRCVSFDCFTFESVYFLQSYHSLSRLFGGFILWKMSSNDELSSDTSSSCDVESLQLAVEGEGFFNSIVQRYRVELWKKEM